MTTVPAASAAPGIELFRYDPLLPVLPGPIGARLPWRRRLGNFGDLLGPLVVEAMLWRRGIAPPPPPGKRDPPRRRLLSVGSVLHFARDGDVAWGSGRNGKVSDECHRFTQLDVRAVRGPLTRDYLLARGIDCPAVYGDPALLLPGLMPWLTTLAPDKRHTLTVVPNYNDLDWVPSGGHRLDPRSPLEQCLKRIANSRLVVATSLHGIVVAEALGVPAQLLRSRVEHPFKYEDYYRGTGRSAFRVADSIEQAVAWGGEPPPRFDPGPLLASFPYDLWP